MEGEKEREVEESVSGRRCFFLRKTDGRKCLWVEENGGKGE